MSDKEEVKQQAEKKKEEEKKFALALDLPKDEKTKNRLLLLGVLFFMALIIILWAFNAKSVLQAPLLSDGDKGSLDINKFSQEFVRTFNEVGAKMSELKNINEADLQKANSAIQQSISGSSTPAAIKK